jgi:ubiquinone/menaquinone biosynthesis C-methylase UbiE
VTDDVPSPIDLRDPRDADAWVRDADAKRPWRAEIRAAIAELLVGVGDILELGAGPGLLAERVLESCSPASYTLFDFSPPMLELARARIGDRARYVLGDFKQLAWSAQLGTFDAIVAMQSIHELRHKRHVPGLYREIHEVLRPGGVLLVCDHSPHDERGLFMTEHEQRVAMHDAGFVDAIAHLDRHGLYLCGAKRAR